MSDNNNSSSSRRRRSFPFFSECFAGGVLFLLRLEKVFFFFFFFFFFVLMMICGASGGGGTPPNAADHLLSCNTTSSCGKIHNISYPFRLKTDPPNCGNRSYELSCENGLTVLHLFSGRYLVQEINYESYSIRVVDAGIQKKGNCSSRPLYDLTWNNFSSSIYDYDDYPYSFYQILSRNHVVTWISCEAPVTAPGYVAAPPALCLVNSSSSSSSSSFSSSTSSSSLRRRRHSYYVVSGNNNRMLRLRDVPDSCTIGISTLVSRDVVVTTSSSLESSPHDDAILAFGFHLSWYGYGLYCYNKCVVHKDCGLDSSSNHIVCVSSHPRILSNVPSLFTTVID